MKLIRFLLPFLGLTGLLLAQDNPASEIPSRIIALEKAWNQAYKLGDRKALDKILDEHIVLINDDGSVQTKAEFLSSVKKNNAQDQQVAPESLNVHVYDNIVIAIGVFRARSVENGKRYVRRERFVDTWLFKGGKWVCVATNATPILE